VMTGMAVMTRRVRRYALVGMLGVALLLLSAPDSYARIVPPRDPREGILDASLVAIVKQAGPDTFEIQEAFLGDAEVGDTIRLPGFRLYTVQMYGPEKVEPIAPDTRVLVFLRRGEKDPTKWEVTDYGYCFFWVHGPGQVDRLRKTGSDALSLRRSWERARDIADERQRVGALWPYLWNHGVSFLRHTLDELAKTGPVAGDYIAERLPSMSYGERATLVLDLGRFGGQHLHTVLIEHLRAQQKLYEDFLALRGPEARVLIEDWATAPTELRNIRGELYYGLAGLAGFRDPLDLPYVRELTLWAIKYRLRQTCGAALHAFRDMPDRANVPVIEAIWKEFSTRPYEGNALSAFDVTGSLRTHKFPETVPVLVQLLGDEHAGREARSFLAKIVGRDLGAEPRAWLDWYMRETQGP
jgi:hypothetical protein